MSVILLGTDGTPLQITNAFDEGLRGFATSTKISFFKNVLNVCIVVLGTAGSSPICRGFAARLVVLPDSTRSQIKARSFMGQDLPRFVFEPLSSVVRERTSKDRRRVDARIQLRTNLAQSLSGRRTRLATTSSLRHPLTSFPYLGKSKNSTKCVLMSSVERLDRSINRSTH